MGVQTRFQGGHRISHFINLFFFFFWQDFINLSSSLLQSSQYPPSYPCTSLLSALLSLSQQLFTMTSLSVSTKFTLYPNATFLQFQYPNRPQRITFPKKTKIGCSAAGQPQRQQRQPKKKKTVTGGEKGVDPVGFLTKFGISHKQFAQFLRERYIKLTHSQLIDHKTCKSLKLWYTKKLP